MDAHELGNALEQLKGLPFPSSPDDPDLADWIVDLVELDGYYAGLATTVAGGGRVSPPAADDLDGLRHRLGEMRVVTPADEEILKDCQSYFRALERLHVLLRS